MGLFRSPGRIDRFREASASGGASAPIEWPNQVGNWLSNRDPTAPAPSRNSAKYSSALIRRPTMPAIAPAPRISRSWRGSSRTRRGGSLRPSAPRSPPVLRPAMAMHRGTNAAPRRRHRCSGLNASVSARRPTCCAATRLAPQHHEVLRREQCGSGGSSRARSHGCRGTAARSAHRPDDSGRGRGGL